MDYQRIDCHHEKHETEFLDSSQENSKASCAPSKLYSVRLVVAFLSLLGTAVMYITRVNLNIAILAMVPQVPPLLDPLPLELISIAVGGNISSSLAEPVAANDSKLISNAASLLPPAEFDWSPPVQGVILGAFFTGTFCASF